MNWLDEELKDPEFLKSYLQVKKQEDNINSLLESGSDSNPYSDITESFWAEFIK